MFPRFMVIPVQEQRRAVATVAQRAGLGRRAEVLEEVGQGAQPLVLPTVIGDAKSCMKMCYNTEEEAKQAAISMAQENPKTIFGILSLGRLFETSVAPVLEKTIDASGQLVPVSGHQPQNPETKVTVTPAAVALPIDDEDEDDDIEPAPNVDGAGDVFNRGIR